jgi:hypothetical protein
MSVIKRIVKQLVSLVLILPQPVAILLIVSALLRQLTIDTICGAAV